MLLMGGMVVVGDVLLSNGVVWVLVAISGGGGWGAIM